MTFTSYDLNLRLLCAQQYVKIKKRQICAREEKLRNRRQVVKQKDDKQQTTGISLTAR